MTENVADIARPPSAPAPEPQPPTAAEAAQLVEAAFAEDDAWGMLVWLAMITGMRRAELCGLKWRYVDLDTGTLVIRRNYLRTGGKDVDKDTKTHQRRHLAIDKSTERCCASTKRVPSSTVTPWA